MLIELPDDVAKRLQAQAQAAGGIDEIEVIRAGLDALQWRDQERAAVMEGIEAWRQGRVRDFDEFDREFRQKHGLPPAT